MSRILVTYATRTGATAEVAGFLADELRLLGHDVDVTPLPSDPSPEGYALVVLGSGVRVRRLYAEAASWVSAHHAELSALPLAVFDVSLSPVVDAAHGHERALHVIERMFERFPALRPVATATFPGAFRPERLSLPEQELVRMMGAEPGDYVDEAAAREWARRLADAVPVSAHPAGRRS